jgi:hypothetical protein
MLKYTHYQTHLCEHWLNVFLIVFFPTYPFPNKIIPILVKSFDFPKHKYQLLKNSSFV